MEEAEKRELRPGEFFFQKKVKFEVFGQEMIEKKVNSSGNSGRIYLPPEWIGKKVKVIKI